MPRSWRSRPGATDSSRSCHVDPGNRSRHIRLFRRATVLHRALLIRLAFLLLLGITSACPAHAYDVLCRDGNTTFHAYFAGLDVDVGPPTRGQLAVRRCRATFTWDDQQLIVAQDVAQIDLDLFGVDLGLGAPVAAFQIKKTDSDCCMTYKIYALLTPPRLLRTLRGGDYFNGADADLNGQVEIWTDDAAAVNGFEGLQAARLHFPPACVLRFDNGRLLDVSSEFRPYFDQEIAQLRQQINSGEAQKFKLSVGKPPAAGPFFKVKQQILELVWAYLYSDRGQQAWQTLAEMWPPADRERIRAAILQMRSRGMRTQVDGVSHALPALQAAIQHLKIYDSTSKPARPVLVRFYPSQGASSVHGKLRVDLVIDPAGKVWSVKVSGKNKAAFDAVKRSTSNWKFIPAMVDGHPVASRLRMNISLEQ